MKSHRIYGHVSELTPEERFWEIRDLFLGCSGVSTPRELSQVAHNKLDIDPDKSVHASRWLTLNPLEEKEL